MYMKKKELFLIKIFILISSLTITIYGLIITFSLELGLCSFERGVKKCLFEHDSIYGDPLIFGALFLLIVSIFTFLISNTIFKKWLIFTAAWMSFTVILVVLAPAYDYSFFGGPTKENVSIWMGTLFVFISILMFIIMSVRERKYNK